MAFADILKITYPKRLLLAQSRYTVRPLGCLLLTHSGLQAMRIFGNVGLKTSTFFQT